MVDINVLNAKLFPRVKNPIVNSVHASIVTITSTVKKGIGIIFSRIIAILDIPPTTRSKGIMKIDAPKAKISVPDIVSITFLIISFAVNLYSFINRITPYSF